MGNKSKCHGRRSREEVQKTEFNVQKFHKVLIGRKNIKNLLMRIGIHSPIL